MFFIQEDISEVPATITTPSKKDGNEPQVVFPGQNALFETRKCGKERPHLAFRDQGKPLLSSEVPRLENQLTKPVLSFSLFSDKLPQCTPNVICERKLVEGLND